MSGFTAILDACVLYPAQLRSFLIYLALTDVYRARWTDEIHEEWMRSILRDHSDLDRAQVERIRDLMNAAVPDGMVTDYEELIPSLSLPDPDDRHVFAAAIQAGAEAIVTSNVSDFPTGELAKYNIEALHPDEFVTNLLVASPHTACDAARRHRSSLKNPPKTVDEYLALLNKAGLVRSVVALRQFAALI